MIKPSAFPKGGIRRTILFSTLVLALVPLIIVGTAAFFLDATGMAATIAMVTIFVFIAVNFTAKHLADPIIHIAEAAESIANGNIQHRVDLERPRSDEIGRLALYFNLMVDKLAKHMDRLEAYVQEHAQARLNLLFQFSQSVDNATSIDQITKAATEFVQHLHQSPQDSATTNVAAEIFLCTDSGTIYYQNFGLPLVSFDERKASLRQWLQRQDGQFDLALFPFPDFQQPNAPSIIAAPIQALARAYGTSATPWEGIAGFIAFLHPTPNHFGPADSILMSTLASQIGMAVQKTGLLSDVKNSLQETKLMLDLSKQLTAATSLHHIYQILIQSVTATGISACALYTINEEGQFALQQTDDKVGLEKYPTPDMLQKLISSDEAISIDLTPHDEPSKIDTLVVPLSGRVRPLGLLLLQRNRGAVFSERERSLYRTMGNQATLAIENAQQMARAETSLRETQTLYHTGQLLAQATSLQEILEKALIEFLNTLGLSQGGVTLLSPDRKFGQLRAYVQNGKLHPGDTIRFPLNPPDAPYQQILLNGQIFVSENAPTDQRLATFTIFEGEEEGKGKREEDSRTPFLQATLQAPMRMNGQTVGWLGADVLATPNDQPTPRHFSHSEIDLAKAMADQITIAMQNRQLLEETGHRAEQLRTVAKLGEVVAEMLDLDKLLQRATDLMTAQLGLQRAAIYVIDEDSNTWASLRAFSQTNPSENDPCPTKINLSAPKALPLNTPELTTFRLTLETHNEPIGYLEVIRPTATLGQHPNSHHQELEIWQIVADQLSAAIEKARLLKQTQRQLMEQATLYRIGRSVGTILELPKAFDSLVTETGQSLDLARCSLLLIDDEQKLGLTNQELANDSSKDTTFPNSIITIISDYLMPDTAIHSQKGQQFPLKQAPLLLQVFNTQKALTINLDNHTPNQPDPQFPIPAAFNQATALVIVPIIVRQRVVAFIEGFDDQTGRRFDDNDLKLLDSIAWQAGTTLDTLRLYQSVQEQQTFLRAIINQLPDPIFIKNRQHQLIVVNEALANFLGQSETALVGQVDYELLPPELGELSRAQDRELFANAKSFELERTLPDSTGQIHSIRLRKTPLWVGNSTRPADDDQATPPNYLLAIVNDVSETRLREAERDDLMAHTEQTLARTQMLYRVSHILDTATNKQKQSDDLNLLATSPAMTQTFQRVMTELLDSLHAQHGAILLWDRSHTHLNLEVGIGLDPTETHPFTQLTTPTDAKLILPLLSRGDTIGLCIAWRNQNDLNSPFSPPEIEMAEAVAAQLARWLENQDLLREAEYRSERLTTAAEVSRVANSILNVDELIDTSVNLIRDQFNFYYVGLFLLDEANEWAVLKAGTGEPGQRMLGRNHRLKIGSGMIGWSVANRQARIALDVGHDAVRFANPDLPDTHSEMALPLISRDEVLGALTVQSTARAAFSNEDITLLQTMADQMANAIKNAHLFAQTQTALAETERLYQLTQELMSTTNETTVYRLAIHALAQLGLDFGAIFTQSTPTTNPTEPTKNSPTLFHLAAAWSINGELPYHGQTSFDQSWPLAELFNAIDFHSTSDPTSITNAPQRTDRLHHPNISPSATTELTKLGLACWMILPLTTSQLLLGHLLVGLHEPDQLFNPSQLRFLNTLTQQLVVALQNLRLLAEAQRRARREEIIREISSKIRSSTKVDEILKTTTSELGKVVGATRGGIRLNISQK